MISASKSCQKLLHHLHRPLCTTIVAQRAPPMAGGKAKGYTKKGTYARVGSQKKLFEQGKHGLFIKVYFLF